MLSFKCRNLLHNNSPFIYPLWVLKWIHLSNSNFLIAFLSYIAQVHQSCQLLLTMVFPPLSIVHTWRATWSDHFGGYSRRWLTDRCWFYCNKWITRDINNITVTFDELILNLGSFSEIYTIFSMLGQTFRESINWLLVYNLSEEENVGIKFKRKISHILDTKWCDVKL